MRFLGLFIILLLSFLVACSKASKVEDVEVVENFNKDAIGKMVEIPEKNYLIDATEITVKQFDECVKARKCQTKNFESINLSHRWYKYCNYGTKNINRPMNCINWYGADEYCKWAGKRLPTDDEWSFAAKGGKEYKFSGSDNPDDVAWYFKNGGDKELITEWSLDAMKTNNNRTHVVAAKKPNDFGIYDMSGNVWEWSSNWVDDKKDRKAAWGGGFYFPADVVKISSRGGDNPTFSNAVFGFRCVKDKN